MTFCDTDIADYTVRNCGVDFAGVVGIGLIDLYESPSIDNLESAEFWTNKEAETPRKYWVIRNTRGQYTDIELTEEEDLIGTIVTGAVHKCVIEVEGLQENYLFWEAAKRKNWKIAITTANGLMFYIESPVTITPKIVNPKSTKQAAYFQVEFTWQALEIPTVAEAPEGTFTGNPTEDEGIFDYTFDYTFE
jgi:hypothetical protein